MSPVDVPAPVNWSTPVGVLVLAPPALLHPVTLEAGMEAEVATPEVAGVGAGLTPGTRDTTRLGAQVGVNTLLTSPPRPLLTIRPSNGLVTTIMNGCEYTCSGGTPV